MVSIVSLQLSPVLELSSFTQAPIRHDKILISQYYQCGPIIICKIPENNGNTWVDTALTTNNHYGFNSIIGASPILESSSFTHLLLGMRRIWSINIIIAAASLSVRFRKATPGLIWPWPPLTTMVSIMALQLSSVLEWDQFWNMLVKELSSFSQGPLEKCWLLGQ